MHFKKILAILMIGILFLLVFIVFNSKIKTIAYQPSLSKLDNNKENFQKENRENIDWVDLKKEYQKNILALLSFYENLIEKNNFQNDDIAKIKEELLFLKLPEEYKQLHLDFLYSLVNTENYLQNQKSEDYANILEMIKNIKKQINWT